MYFSKKNAARKPHREGEVPPSIVAADMKITKNGIFSKGEVHIDGNVEGNIVAREVMVGKEAIVTGNITAQLVRINGKVYGSIEAGEVSLLSHAHVEGNILHSIISIEAGAYFDGSSKRKPIPQPKAEPAKQLDYKNSVEIQTTEVTEKGKVAVSRESKLTANR